MQQWMMIAAAIAGFALQTAASATARDYPERPITLIVPQAPGGGNDVIARILAETMSRTLGQQIIVENRPGAGGTIGTRQLAKSPPEHPAVNKHQHQPQQQCGHPAFERDLQEVRMHVTDR